MSYSDKELEIMSYLSRNFEVLDRTSRKRVLTWVDHRFVSGEPFEVGNFDQEGFTNFTKALVEASRKLGNIAPIDILKFAEYVQELKAKEAASEEAPDV